jgi:hypothetical protein
MEETVLLMLIVINISGTLKGVTMIAAIGSAAMTDTAGTKELTATTGTEVTLGMAIIKAETPDTTRAVISRMAIPAEDRQPSLGAAPRRAHSLEARRVTDRALR